MLLLGNGFELILLLAELGLLLGAGLGGSSGQLLVTCHLPLPGSWVTTEPEPSQSVEMWEIPLGMHFSAVLLALSCCPLTPRLFRESCCSHWEVCPWKLRCQQLLPCESGLVLPKQISCEGELGAGKPLPVLLFMDGCCEHWNYSTSLELVGVWDQNSR